MEEKFTLWAADIGHMITQDAVQSTTVPAKEQTAVCSKQSALCCSPAAGGRSYLDSNSRTSGSRRWLKAAIFSSESSV